MNAIRFPCLALVTCLALSGLARAADGYAIKLVRPAKVGQRYEVQVTGTLGETTITALKGQAAPQDRNLKVELTATAQVLETDDRGREVRIAYTVRKCERNLDGQTSEVIAPGTVITVLNEGGRKQFLLKEGTLAAEARSSLDLVLHVHTGDTDDDDLFGTRARQPVGGSWAVDREAAAKILGPMFPGIQASNVVGSASFSGLQQTNGVECLTVTGQLKVDGIKLPTPPDMDLSRAKSEMRFMALLPADGSRGRLAERSEIDLSLNFTGRPGSERADTTLAHKREIRVERRFSYPGP